MFFSFTSYFETTKPNGLIDFEDNKVAVAPLDVLVASMSPAFQSVSFYGQSTLTYTESRTFHAGPSV